NTKPNGRTRSSEGNLGRASYRKDGTFASMPFYRNRYDQYVSSMSCADLEPRTSIFPVFGEKRRKFLAQTAREFTTIEYGDWLQEACEHPINHSCSTFGSKGAYLSGHLPIT